MKHKYFLIISVITVLILCFLAQNRFSSKLDEKERMDSLKQENLFVLVNSDTIAHYLNKCAKASNKYQSLKVEEESDELLISYNQHALILLNRADNGMYPENKLFENITENKDGQTFIKLNITKKDGVKYVKCPAPILVEILRMKDNKSLP